MKQILFCILISCASLSGMHPHGIIQWSCDQNATESVYCYVDPRNIVFEHGDAVTRRRWSISDNAEPFFSPYSIQKEEKCSACSNLEYSVFSAIKSDRLDCISVDQKNLRKTFLYIPVSALKNNNGKWKKSGDLLLNANTSGRSYDVFLKELREVEDRLHYQTALEVFCNKQQSIINVPSFNRDLLLWFLRLAVPLYTHCSHKERKQIGMFVLTNLFFKICKLR